MQKRLPKFEPARLTQARLARKLSMAEVAERVGVTRQAVSAYESGENFPSPEILRKLAAELNAPEAFFTMPMMEPTGTVINFRSLAASVKKSRDQARIYLEWLVSLSKFCMQFVELPPVRLPQFDIADFSRLQDVDLEKFAEETRRYFGLGDGPISDLTLLLENHGVLIGFVGLDPGIDGLSAWYGGRPVVLINDKAYFARSRYDLAHELAHLILHRAVAWDDLENKDTLRLLEDQAQKFASAFLMPERSFVPEVYGLDEVSLLELKRRWGVAMQAIVMRLHSVRMIGDEQKMRLFKWFSYKGYRRKEPLDEETRPERPKLIKRVADLLHQNGILLKEEFTVRSRLPAAYVRAVADLPEYSPVPRNVIEFATLRRSNN